MTIDSHQHFWKYDPKRHSWITDTMAVLRRDYLPTHLEPLLQEQGVAGCVAVQADMSEAETEFLLQCAAEHPFIKGVVGWVDLLDQGVGERLEYFVGNPLLKGIRHIVQDEADDRFMLRPDFQAGIARLESLGLAYDILIYPKQLTAAVELVRRFPAQRFVIDHIAKPRISRGVDPWWKKQMQALAAFPNTACKLSGMVTETDGFRWEREDLYPFMDAVLEAFGADRLLFGSDWPVCLLAGSYESVKQVVDSYTGALTGTERQLIMGGNARRWYAL